MATKKADPKPEPKLPEAPAPESVIAISEWLPEARLDAMTAAALTATHRGRKLTRAQWQQAVTALRNKPVQ